jgi:hypothetical protein
MKTANKIFWNLRKFEVEYLYTDNGNFASIKEDGKSHNIELLSSLLESAKETLKEKSLLVHEVAKEKMK